MTTFNIIKYYDSLGGGLMCSCINSDACDCFKLYIDSDRYIQPGCVITLGRFEGTTWTVHFGWYEYGGNRPVFGMYLIDNTDGETVRPLQGPDLVDIQIISYGGGSKC